MSVVLNEYKSKLENKHIKLSMNLPTDIFQILNMMNKSICIYAYLMQSFIKLKKIVFLVYKVVQLNYKM